MTTIDHIAQVLTNLEAAELQNASLRDANAELRAAHLIHSTTALPYVVRHSHGDSSSAPRSFAFSASIVLTC